MYKTSGKTERACYNIYQCETKPETVDEFIDNFAEEWHVGRPFSDFPD